MTLSNELISSHHITSLALAFTKTSKKDPFNELQQNEICPKGSLRDFSPFGWWGKQKWPTDLGSSLVPGAISWYIYTAFPKGKGNPIFLFMEGNFFTDQWDPAPEILYLTSPPHPLRISPPYLVIINNPFCPDCFAYWIILFLPPKRKSLLYWVETQKLQIKQHIFLWYIYRVEGF